MIKDVLDENSDFVIYGAQVIAYGAFCALKHLYGYEPENFAVSNLDKNPFDIEGIKVKLIDEVATDKLIIVGVTELVQKEVVPFLQDLGFTNLFVLTQHEEFLLMSEYFNSLGLFEICKYKDGNSEKNLGLYEVCNHRDAVLTFPPLKKPFEITIQAGAAITEERIAEFVDSTKDNISKKNKQYCEMSATYWVWKNTRHDWKGIEHYRRHILVTPAMLDDDVDVILPLPYICYPNTLAQFKRFVSDRVCDALFEALRIIHPNEYVFYEDILYGKYQYTYNIVCARKDVFDSYCKWFFEITEYMETMADRVPEINETRALSYVAEVLTNLYFMSMGDKLRIKHTEREIYT